MKETTKMTVTEQRFIETLMDYVVELVKQLKMANQLKALELKGRQDLNLSPEMVDEVLEG